MPSSFIGGELNSIESSRSSKLESIVDDDDDSSTVVNDGYKLYSELPLAVIKQFAGTGYESSDVMVIDEVEMQRHQNLDKLYRSTRAGKINGAIVRPIPHGVKLHAIKDSCHSGTVLDLPFLCRMDRSGKYVWEDHRPRSGVWKGTSGGEVISISGCDDNQTSADTSALSRITYTGAMTFCFIQAIERGQAATYGSILNSMRNTIRSTGSGGGGGSAVASLLGGSGGAVTSLVGMLLNGGSVGGGGL